MLPGRVMCFESKSKSAFSYPKMRPTDASDDDRADSGGDWREEPLAPGAQRLLRGEALCSRARSSSRVTFDREVGQVDAALGRDGVAVAFGDDQHLGAVAVRHPLVLGRDRPHGVVVEEPHPPAGGEVVDVRPAVARLADHAEQAIVAEESRQHVVLDLARQALFAACRRP